MKRKISIWTLLGNWKKIVEHKNDGDNNCLGAITKGLVQGLEDLEVRGRVETIETSLLRSTRILRRIQETRRDLLSLNLQ